MSAVRVTESKVSVREGHTRHTVGMRPMSKWRMGGIVLFLGLVGGIDILVED